jgi:hypothetical protein
MTEEQKNLLEKLKWDNERKLKQSQLAKKLKSFLAEDSFLFLTFDESDKIQRINDGWPANKWSDNLYLQTEITNPSYFSHSIEKYIELNSDDFLYIFFMNYNFGLVKIKNDTLINFWAKFIEIDSDEVFCYLPNRTDFICLEKTEDFISGKEQEGRQWIYELTFSNTILKTLLTQNGS